MDHGELVKGSHDGSLRLTWFHRPHHEDHLVRVLESRERTQLGALRSWRYASISRSTPSHDVAGLLANALRRTAPLFSTPRRSVPWAVGKAPRSSSSLGDPCRQARRPSSSRPQSPSSHGSPKGWGFQLVLLHRPRKRRDRVHQDHPTAVQFEQERQLVNLTFVAEDRIHRGVRRDVHWNVHSLERVPEWAVGEGDDATAHALLGPQLAEQLQ